MSAIYKTAHPYSELFRYSIDNHKGRVVIGIDERGAWSTVGGISRHVSKCEMLYLIQRIYRDEPPYVQYLIDNILSKLRRKKDRDKTT